MTCVGDLIEPEVPAAAVAVLRRAGATVTVPAGQTCCGQPAWNAGFAAEAAAVARASLDALAAIEPGSAEPDGGSALPDVVVPAGSCATMIRLYWPTLFDTVGDAEAAGRARALSGRVYELTEWLAARGGELPPLSMPACRVVYHRSCHMERELHVRDQPTELLARVEGCEVAEWEAADRCCGFGGTFSVKLPEASTAMADEKLDTLPSGVTEIIGADASCLLQLRTRAEQRGLPVTTRHIAALLDEAVLDQGVKDRAARS